MRKFHMVNNLDVDGRNLGFPRNVPRLRGITRNGLLKIPGILALPAPSAFPEHLAVWPRWSIVDACAARLQANAWCSWNRYIRMSYLEMGKAMRWGNALPSERNRLNYPEKGRMGAELRLVACLKRRERRRYDAPSEIPDITDRAN